MLTPRGKGAKPSGVRIRVECDATSPARFVLGDRTVEVAALLDRWYGDEADYFRVRVAGGDLYVLKHLRGHDRWELTSFTRHGSVGTSVEAERPRVLH